MHSFIARMSNKRSGVITALLTLLAALGVGFGHAGIAKASSDGLNVSPVSTAQSLFDLTTTDAAVDTDQVTGSAMLNGKLEIMAQQPKLERKLGKKLTRKERKKLLQGHSGKIQHIHGMTCKWGIAIWSPSTTSSGKTVWIPKRGNHGLTHGCLVDGVWRQILGGKKQWNCGNEIVWIHEQLPEGAVTYTGPTVIVSHFTFTVHVTAKATAQVLGAAEASCTAADGSSSASATVAAWGWATASASASAKGRTAAKATAKAKNGTVNALNKQRETLTMNATAAATTNVSGQATAWCQGGGQKPPAPPTPPTCQQMGTCEQPPPPTCKQTNTCQPPPCGCQQKSPPSATVDFVQEIDASDYSTNPPLTYTTPIRAHVTAKAGDSLTVTFTARYGSWPQNNSVQKVTSTGTDLVTATYQSPTEEVKEQVKVVVFDNTTGLSVTEYSNEFDVMKPPPPPE
jgi:hypothetical protein